MSRESGVPRHWETATLEEIAEVRLGRQRSPERSTGNHMRPYMRAANVTWAGISLHDVKEMDFSPKEFETYALRPGDILLAEASGSASEVGKPAIWRDDVANCCFQNTLLRVRAPESLVRFLHLHFTKDALTGAFATASRGVGIYHLGAEAMCQWEIRLPPLREQGGIVEAIESYFSRLDDAVATLERVERNLKRYRASVLKSAVEGRLVPTEAALAKEEGREYEPASVLLERILTERRRRWSESGGKGKYQEPTPPDTSNLPDLPEGWCWATVEQLASPEPRSIQSGPFGSSLRHSEFTAEGKLVVGIDNVQDGYFSMGTEHRISEEKYKVLQKFTARPGDVLVTVMATIGRTCVIPEDLETAIITKHVYRVSACRTLVLPRFLHLCLWGGPAVREQMFGQVQGQTRPGLNGSIIKRLAIPLPPLSEQARILGEADRLLSVGMATQEETAHTERRLARLRQSILKWAFEGKLVDQDPLDEPASVLLERIRTERETAKPVTATRLERGAKKKQVRA